MSDLAAAKAAVKSIQPLTLVLTTKQALQAHYLPFLKRGGIFVPTPCALRPGSEVQVYLQLPDATEPLLITGQLAWYTPAGAQGQKLAGVGVHFSEDDDFLKSQIEALLVGLPDNHKPSHTL